MEEALREELASLSGTEWAAMTKVGHHGSALFNFAGRMGWVPADASAAIPMPSAANETVRLSGDEEKPKPAPPPMTLYASLLGELLDNYLLAERLEKTWTEPRDRTRATRDVAQARQALSIAMAEMSEKDWASLDQFPELARHVRVTTDRLREEFRSATSLNIPPSLSTTIHANATYDTVLETLGRRGFRPVSFPVLPEAVGREIVVARERIGVVIRFFPLGGLVWRAAEGSLGPWEAIGGDTIVSPCRALWQRLLLMKVLSQEFDSIKGIVAMSDGKIDDEIGIAGCRERIRCGIELAWLDRPSGHLPSITDALDRLTASALPYPSMT